MSGIPYWDKLPQIKNWLTEDPLRTLEYSLYLVSIGQGIETGILVIPPLMRGEYMPAIVMGGVTLTYAGMGLGCRVLRRNSHENNHDGNTYR